MNKKHIWLIIGCILVIALVLAYAFIIYFEWLPIKNYGIFGDSFGILTALFSGLAFAGLIMTFIMQGDELKAQREELKLTRQTFELQKDEMKAQNETLAKQRFENTFFTVLGFLEVCVEDLRCRHVYSPKVFRNDGGEIANGRDAIKVLYDIFHNKYLHSEMKEGIAVDFKKECKKKAGISKEYKKFYDKNEGNLGQYYRVLYNILKLVDNAKLDENEKSTYANLVCAKLSKYELLLIFYNCLSPLGEKKIAPLIKKYKILKHLDKSLLPKENLTIFKEFSKL